MVGSERLTSETRHIVDIIVILLLVTLIYNRHDTNRAELKRRELDNSMKKQIYIMYLSVQTTNLLQHKTMLGLLT